MHSNHMGCCVLQHCPPGRFLLFASVGLALYVMGPAPLRRAWHRLLAMLPPMHVRPGTPPAASCWLMSLEHPGMEGSVPQGSVVHLGCQRQPRAARLA